jgi:UDP-2,4-diacetamido-2,4,6-trideoxy-beta-L-altropyranose hydrolase
LSLPKLIFRADGNSQIGLGHIYRCLALAEILKDQFNCLFVTQDIPDSLAQQIAQSYSHIKVNQQHEFIQLSAAITTHTIIVLDGYHFNETYQLKLKALGVKLVLISDFEQANLVVDIVINHGTKNTTAYNGLIGTHAKSYTGFKYLILRQAFLAKAKLKRAIPSAHSLFICMGGADPFNLTLLALKAALSSKFITRINIVTGAAYTHQQALSQFINNTQKDVAISLFSNINSEAIASLLEQSSMAICTSSSIALEACCIKTGLLTGYMVDNQQAIHEQLKAENCCISVGDFREANESTLTEALYQLNNPDYLAQIITNQTRVFDGNSGERIVELFQALVNE